MTDLKYKACFGRFKTISEDKESDGYVYIKGYANYSAPDEVNERLDPMSVDATRFQKNSPLLYNHDPALIVGDVMEWESRENGIFIKKARISKSEVPQVKYVRDLVLEGILKGLSVGFSDGDTEKDPLNPKGFLTKNWKWFELSIVPLPMQADSLLSVQKSFNSQLGKCKNLSEARIMTLKLKGAAVAALIAPVLEQMDTDTKNEAMLLICEQSGCTQEELNNIITGETTSVPEPQLAAIGSVLGISPEDLGAANATDSKSLSEQPKEQSEEKNVPEEKPESATELPEDSKTMEPEESEESEESKTMEPEESEESDSLKEMNTCVSEKITALIAEGQPQDQAVAMAIAMCSEEKGCAPSALSEKQWSDYTALAVKAAQDSEASQNFDPEKKEEEKSGVKIEKKTYDTQDNPTMIQMQAMNATLGSIANKIDSLLQLLVTYMSLDEKKPEQSDDSLENLSMVESDSHSEKETKSLLAEARALNMRLKSYLE